MKKRMYLQLKTKDPGDMIFLKDKQFSLKGYILTRKSATNKHADDDHGSKCLCTF
jgi:hypothetical protein